MAVIAVAGGTGGLGRAIVDVLVSDGKHRVLLLTRKVDEAKEKEIGAPMVAVDYGNAETLAVALETNKVQTVISAMNMMDHQPELNLVKAAEKSTTTKRYIPSTWGIRYTAELAQSFPLGKGKFEVLQALEATSLEYTAVMNGYFLDYFLTARVKTYMSPLATVLDMPNNLAAIPGSGDVPVVFTHSFDVARFVAAVLTLNRWEKESYIIGDKVTWNQFLKIAEDAKGVKFNVVHDSLDSLKEGKATELPTNEPMYAYIPKEMFLGLLASFGVLFENGTFDMKPVQTLNKTFPSIKARTVRELVQEAWK